jgi:hypothetical protein
MGADFPVLPRINPTRGAGEVRNPELEELKEKLLKIPKDRIELH